MCSRSRSAIGFYPAIVLVLVVLLDSTNVARGQTVISIHPGNYLPYYYRDTGNPKIDLVIVEPWHRVGVGASATVGAFRLYLDVLLEIRMNRGCNVFVGVNSFYRLRMSVESSEDTIEQCVRQLLEIFADRRIDDTAYARVVRNAAAIGAFRDAIHIWRLSPVALVQIYGTESTIGRIADFKPHHLSSVDPATVLTWWEDVATYGRVLVLSNRPGSSYEIAARNLAAAHFENRDHRITVRDRPILDRRLNHIPTRVPERHAYLIALQARINSYGDEFSVWSATRPYCDREGIISSIFARRHIEVSDVRCSFESLGGDVGWQVMLITLPFDVRGDYSAILENELLPEIVGKLSNAERIPADPVTPYQVKLEALIRDNPDWNKNEDDPAPTRNLFGGRYYIFSTARDPTR